MHRKRQHTDRLNPRLDPDLRAAVEQIAEAKGQILLAKSNHP